MKDIADANNRKLIRPSLSELRENSYQPKRRGGNNPQLNKDRRGTPPGQTNAENFYYVKQMQNRTPMAVVLKDGEVLRGVIEWYDKTCLKINRDDGANILIYKDSIKYMYKEAEKGAKSERGIDSQADAMTA